MDDAPIVLVVDDEPDVASLAAEFLIQAGCCVVPAKTGTDALQILRDFRVDVMLTDMRMPRPDCWDLLEAVRRTSPSTAAIVMTGCATEILHREAESRGAVGVLSKPFSRGDLITAVMQAADGRRQRRKAVGM